MAKLDISRGSVLNKKALLLHKVECAVQVLTATNVTCPQSSSNLLGGKIGHIARNCPMNEGGYSGGGGFGGQQGYSDSGKTCYACGGFGKICFPIFSYAGHMAKDCSQGQKCYNCGRLGHVSRDCDQAAQAKVCYRFFLTISLLIIDANNLGTSPATVPTIQLRQASLILSNEKWRTWLRAIILLLFFAEKSVYSYHLKQKKIVLF